MMTRVIEENKEVSWVPGIYDDGEKVVVMAVAIQLMGFFQEK